MTIVDIKSLHKSFKTGWETQVVLSDFNLQIQKGEFVGLYGRSGCGKSTLMQIIGCLDEFDSGEYYFCGQKINPKSFSQNEEIRKSKIGYIFQNFNLISTLNVIENIEFPLYFLGESSEVREKKSLEILHAVGLEKFKNRFPSELSGGQRQRVAIARALVKEPLLVVADEPTASLDEENSQLIAELLIQLQQKYQMTVLCSSHDKIFLDYSHKKFTIKNGKVG